MPSFLLRPTKTISNLPHRLPALPQTAMGIFYGARVKGLSPHELAHMWAKDKGPAPI